MRPRKFDYPLIMRLREEGLGPAGIARKIGASRYGVNRILSEISRGLSRVEAPSALLVVAESTPAVRLSDELGIRTCVRTTRRSAHSGGEFLRDGSGWEHIALPFVSILADMYQPEPLA